MKRRYKKKSLTCGAGKNLDCGLCKLYTQSSLQLHRSKILQGKLGQQKYILPADQSPLQVIVLCLYNPMERLVYLVSFSFSSLRLIKLIYFLDLMPVQLHFMKKCFNPEEMATQNYYKGTLVFLFFCITFNYF